MGLFAVIDAPISKISVARDFSTSPGFRYPKDGPFSGELFRTSILEKLFESDSENIIEINLDGTEGYATSFLEEAFGGLARKYGAHEVTKRLKLVSDEDPTLITEINGYIDKVAKNEK